jgi:hypothetical protein
VVEGCVKLLQWGLLLLLLLLLMMMMMMFATSLFLAMLHFVVFESNAVWIVFTVCVAAFRERPERRSLISSLEQSLGLLCGVFL